MKITFEGKAVTTTRHYRIGNFGKRRTYVTTYVSLDESERAKLVDLGAIPSVQHARVVLPSQSNEAWPAVAAHAGHKVRVRCDLRFRFPESAAPCALRPIVECADVAEHVLEVLA